MKNACVFCSLPQEDIIAETRHVKAVRDIRPVTPGHSLIIPKRHFQSLFEAGATEWMEIMEVLRLVKDDLERQAAPKGFNIAVNINPIAGQVIMHAHIHLIPRYGTEEKFSLKKGFVHL